MSAFVSIGLWISAAILPPTWYLLSNQKPARAVALPDAPANELESKIYRNALVGTGPLSVIPENQVSTLYELLKRAAVSFKNFNTFGMRELVKIVEEEKTIKKVVAGVESSQKKVWKFFEMSEYKWLTYQQVYDTAICIGAGLKKIGMDPSKKLTIFAPTNRDWMLMAHGAFSQSIVITTAYDTLGEEGLSFSLNEGQVETLFTSHELLTLMPKISSLSPSLKNVIYSGPISNDILEKVKPLAKNLKFFHISEIIELGKQNPVAPVPPKSSDVCCIMYTSGSTGNPKGVVLTHANIISSVAGTEKMLGKNLGSGDVYLAFLPLAHILEFFVETYCLHKGVALGYGSVKTLTAASVRNCEGDIAELKPTVMAGVPAVWEGIRKGVLSKVGQMSPTIQKLFGTMFAMKWASIQYGLPTFMYDAIIFNKIKQATGGRLKFALSGGAPIPKETHIFLTVCICPVIQGMTETCGMISLQGVDQIGILSQVGTPQPALEVKLVGEIDSKYSVHNKPNPQGEIWVRGGNITAGYYKQPKVTSETFTPDGWLMTGDIGEILPDGCISIIDRKKNLIKLSNGEYIALEKLESIYKSSTLVQHCCVVANPEKSYCMILVVPVEKEFIRVTVEAGLANADEIHELSDLAGNAKLTKFLLDNLIEVGKSAALMPAELVGACLIIGEDWTPQSGQLTAAMKLKRKDIEAAYKTQITKVYI